MSTRGNLIEKALKIIGDQNRLVDARDWLDLTLSEIESRGFWEFLEKSTTYQTENTVQSVAFSEAKWPSSAITDFSKGLILNSDEPRKLIRISKAALDAANDNATGNPTHYAVWNKTVYFYPTPVTSSLPLLTVRYFKEITFPTSDTDVIETVTGILPKYEPFLVNGIIAWGMEAIDDGRQNVRRQIWERNLQIMENDNDDYRTYVESFLDRPSINNRKIEAIATQG
jgi:hypothetical protein